MRGTRRALVASLGGLSLTMILAAAVLLAGEWLQKRRLPSSIQALQLESPEAREQALHDLTATWLEQYLPAIHELAGEPRALTGTSRLAFAIHDLAFLARREPHPAPVPARARTFTSPFGHEAEVWTLNVPDETLCTFIRLTFGATSVELHQRQLLVSASPDEQGVITRFMDYLRDQFLDQANEDPAACEKTMVELVDILHSHVLPRARILALLEIWRRVLEPVS